MKHLISLDSLLSVTNLTNLCGSRVLADGRLTDLDQSCYLWNGVNGSSTCVRNLGRHAEALDAITEYLDRYLQ